MMCNGWEFSVDFIFYYFHRWWNSLSEQIFLNSWFWRDIPAARQSRRLTTLITIKECISSLVALGFLLLVLYLIIILRLLKLTHTDGVNISLESLNKVRCEFVRLPQKPAAWIWQLVDGVTATMQSNAHTLPDSTLPICSVCVCVCGICRADVKPPDSLCESLPLSDYHFELLTVRLFG